MKTLIIIFALAFCTFAQEEDPLKYFPYRTGDMWEYFWYDTQFPDTLQNFNIKDSIDAEGNMYVWQSARFINPVAPPALLSDTSIYKIDTAFNVFCLTCPIENQFLYKLNAQKDEQWVAHIYQDSSAIYGYEMVRVREIWNGELFGMQTTYKNYMYYFAPDSTDTLGLVRYGSTLAYNFGLYYKGGGDAVGDIYLKGCVINDTLYGDTTKIITSVKDLSVSTPTDFELLPNYPNPFNPNTTIKYSVKESGFVQLKVYDILGNEVAVLVNEEKKQGSYSVTFDGSNLTSGVYFYSLRVNKFVQNRKMVLLR